MAFRAVAAAAAASSSLGRQGHLAAAAPRSWRRLLASDVCRMSKDELERFIEGKVFEALQKNAKSRVLELSPEVDELMVQKIHKILKDDPSITKPTQESIMFVENSTNKQAIEFNKKLTDQREFFINEVSSLMKKQDDYSAYIMKELDSLADTCDQRSLDSDESIKILRQQHDSFSKKSEASVRQTRFNIVKVVTGAMACMALVGFIFLPYLPL